MDIIRLLPDAIANQIAAGEVIQRPASVLKELVENAIDAESSEISVIIKSAGKTLIQVIDNGVGMTETDARMCFERHATSKIKVAKDLFSISTKGFRGEALASIAAVAQVELKTRRADEELATRIVIADTKVEKQEFVQAPSGTSIAVKNLFFNVPARRNFLKSDPVELKHLIEEFQRIALAHHQVFFRFYHNDEEIFHLPPVNLRQRIVAIFGKSINEKLVPVKEETDIVSISGFASKPDYSKKTRGEQYFFVNNRFIKSHYLNHAIKSVYATLIPEGHFPLYVLFLSIDPKQIDVNVHPTKQEIKFQQERLVYNIIKVSVKHALGQYSVSSTFDFEKDPGLERMLQHHESGSVPQFESGSGSPGAWKNLYSGLEHLGNQPQHQTIPSEYESGEGSGLLDVDPKEGMKEPLQILQSYIFVPIKSGFMILDQQAAHERILYERYLNHFKTGECATQKELFPVTIELSVADAMILKQILEHVQLLGFDIQEFGGETFVVHGIPSHLTQEINHEEVILKLVDQFKESVKVKLDKQEQIAKGLALSTSLRRGKKLKTAEMQELVDQLFGCEMPYKSPAGRNCFITFDKNKLDRQFLS